MYGYPNDALSGQQTQAPAGYPPPAGEQMYPPSSADDVAHGLHRLSLREHLPHVHRPHLPHYFHRKSDDEIICGPLLRYSHIDYARRTWHGSCLVVGSGRHAPTIEVETSCTSGTSQRITLQAEEIDSFRRQYRFWRYDITLPMLNESQKATYTCQAHRFTFHLPALQESMRFMFYSCNGFSDIPQEQKDRFGEKTQPLWSDFLDRHEIMPFHVLLGGGDQLYQDRIIKEDFMKPWVIEKDPKIRLAMHLSHEMRDNVENFYFTNYVQNFGFKGSPVVAKAFATVPSINMWDDHDIIDGYGSYPSDMQQAHMFQVMFANASRFYYLFQHHTTVELAESHGMIRGHLATCNSVVTTLGPDIAVMALDCRGERTKFDICHPSTYDTVFNAAYRLPRTVKHMLLVTGVPLVYPRLTFFEKAMDTASGFNLATGALGGVVQGQLNKWNGDPELLDDMNDHWTAGNHLVERTKLIERCQQFARERSIRVSLLGGDVHCCAAGKLYSKDMKDREEGDPYLMVQIVSSAIMNVPPPQALLTILNQNASNITFNGNIEEKMYNLFKRSPNGNTRNNKKLMGARNYCAGYYDKSTGKINFWIQAEKEVGQKGTMGYLVDVPRLVFGQAAYQLYHAPSTRQDQYGGMVAQ